MVRVTLVLLAGVNTAMAVKHRQVFYLAGENTCQGGNYGSTENFKVESWSWSEFGWVIEENPYYEFIIHTGVWVTSAINDKIVNEEVTFEYRDANDFVRAAKSLTQNNIKDGENSIRLRCHIQAGLQNVADEYKGQRPGGNLGGSNKGLNNQFKNSSVKQATRSLDSHVKSGKLQPKYSNPKNGAKSYYNPKSKYSYNIDPGLNKDGTKKVEPSHIDVNYPNKSDGNKKKLPIKDDD